MFQGLCHALLRSFPGMLWATGLSPAQPASPLVRGGLLRSNAWQLTYSQAPIFFFPNLHSMVQILPFPRSGNMVAARDHANLQERAVMDQFSWIPSPLLSPWEPAHCKAHTVQRSFARPSVGTTTSVKYTVSLNGLFSGYNSKHQCFYLHILTVIFTFRAFSHFRNCTW